MFDVTAFDALPVDAAECRRLAAMWALESAAMADGFRQVAGVDEAGRGPLAGPVVAAAVRLAHPVPGLNDSKRLTSHRRDALFAALMEAEHDVGIGVVEAVEIDRLGIQRANYLAMRRAVEAMRRLPDLLLVDGYALPDMPMPVRRVVRVAFHCGGKRNRQSVPRPHHGNAGRAVSRIWLRPAQGLWRA